MQSRHFVSVGGEFLEAFDDKRNELQKFAVCEMSETVSESNTQSAEESRHRRLFLWVQDDETLSGGKFQFHIES
jgi:hypothetical protein